MGSEAMDPWCLLEEVAARVLLAAGGLLGCRKELVNHAQTLQVVGERLCQQ